MSTYFGHWAPPLFTTFTWDFLKIPQGIPSFDCVTKFDLTWSLSIESHFFCFYMKTADVNPSSACVPSRYPMLEIVFSIFWQKLVRRFDVQTTADGRHHVKVKRAGSIPVHTVPTGRGLLPHLLIASWAVVVSSFALYKILLSDEYVRASGMQRIFLARKIGILKKTRTKNSKKKTSGYRMHAYFCSSLQFCCCLVFLYIFQRSYLAAV